MVLASYPTVALKKDGGKISHVFARQTPQIFGLLEKLTFSLFPVVRNCGSCLRRSSILVWYFFVSLKLPSSTYFSSNSRNLHWADDFFFKYYHYYSSHHRRHHPHLLTPLRMIEWIKWIERSNDLHSFRSYFLCLLFSLCNVYPLKYWSVIRPNSFPSNLIGPTENLIIFCMIWNRGF